MPSYRSMVSSTAALALAAFVSFPAFAASEQEIGDALTKMITAGDAGTTVTLGTPAADGDALVYSNVAVKSTDGTETAITTLTVTGGELNDKGNLTAASLKAEGVAIKDATSTGAIQAIEITGFDAGSMSSNPDEFDGRLETLTVTDMKIEQTGQPPVAIGSIAFEASDYTETYPRKVSVSVEGIDIDPATAGEGDPTAAQLKALGYDRINMSLYADGVFSDSDGTFTLNEFTIDGADMGALSLGAVLGGFTPEVLVALNQPEPPMEMLAQLTLVEGALSFTDASITNRLVDMQASQMGVDRAAFVDQITAALPLMLSALQNPEFQGTVAEAATTFLKDPKNITLYLTPEQPVPLMEIAGAAETAPQTLPQLLGATIAANEAE